MQNEFDSLKTQFSTFVGDFSSWAKHQEEADEKKIRDLYDDIRKLDASIFKNETATKAVAAALAATVPITSTLATLFPLAAPFIIVRYHYSCFCLS